MNPNEVKPGTTGPVMDVQRPQANTTPPASAMAPADNITASMTDPHIQANTTIRKRPKGKIIVLVAGIVIILAAASTAFYFLILKEDAKNTPAPAPTVVEDTSSDANERVRTDEIDTLVTDIDNTLNTLNDSQDFTQNDISDSALGL